MYNPPPCVAIVALPLDGDAAEVVLLLLVMFVSLPVVLELVPPTIVCPSVVVLLLEVVVVLPDVVLPEAVVFPVVVGLAVAPVLAELLVVAAILVVVSSEEAIEPVAVNVEPPAVVAFVPVVALPAVVAFVPVVAFDVRFCATAVLERLDAVTKSPKTSTSAIAIDAFFIARRAYIDQF
jgi:hypothetical protein